MLEIVGMPIWVLFQKKTTWTEFRGSGFQDRGWALEVRGSGIGEETQEAADYLVAMPSRSGSVAERRHCPQGRAPRTATIEICLYPI